MELQKSKAGTYLFLYNPLNTEVFVKQSSDEWEIEIYKYKHFVGSLEIDKNGKIYIVEDINLSLKKVEENVFEVE